MSAHHTPEVMAIMRKARPIIKAQLPAPCIRCGGEVLPTSTWHVGHRVDVAKGGDANDVGPEHARCNLSAGGRAGAAKTNAGKTAARVEDKRLFQW